MRWRTYVRSYGQSRDNQNCLFGYQIWLPHLVITFPYQWGSARRSSATNMNIYHALKIMFCYCTICSLVFMSRVENPDFLQQNDCYSFDQKTARKIPCWISNATGELDLSTDSSRVSLFFRIIYIQINPLKRYLRSRTTDPTDSRTRKGRKKVESYNNIKYVS